MSNKTSRSRRNPLLSCARFFALGCALFALKDLVWVESLEAQLPLAAQQFANPNQPPSAIVNQSVVIQNGTQQGQFQFAGQSNFQDSAEPVSPAEQLLLDSLKKQAVEIQLYNPQAKVAGSYAWITKSMDRTSLVRDESASQPLSRLRINRNWPLTVSNVLGRSRRATHQYSVSFSSL